MLLFPSRKQAKPPESEGGTPQPQLLHNASSSNTPTIDDVAQSLSVWLDIPTYREGRRFLEAHLELLAPLSDILLNERIAQGFVDQLKVFELRDARVLLQDARQRGGTGQAVREAYVNAHSGMVLDVPSWLAEAELKLNKLQRDKQSAQSQAAAVDLLRDTIARAQEDVDLAPEALAALHTAYAKALEQDPRAERAQALENAIAACETALQISTLTRYPCQYAAIQNVLGLIYSLRVRGKQRENVERAIACCHEALGVLTRDVYPVGYATIQGDLGWAYLYRVEGERRENVERAITCYQEALHIFTLDAYPVEFAIIQRKLGVTYDMRVAGDRRENVEQAIMCYQQALHVFTLETYPLDYAKTQGNLGNAYDNRIAGERRENLERAILCYQEAARVQTLEAWPVKYALNHVNLAIVYKHRLQGERRENLERAIACNQKALQVYTLDAFPEKYAMVQLNLGEVYLNRIEGEQRENLERAIACNQKALQVYTLEDFPLDYAMVQLNLGEAYLSRIVGERGQNIERAVACYYEALRVYTLDAFPSEHRSAQLNMAEAQAMQLHWPGVHHAYIQALKAEDLLVALGAGAVGQDAILKEGRDAAVRDGFALVQVGRVEESAVVIERGRARGLSEAMMLHAANPDRIGNGELRSRYTKAQHSFTIAQAALQAPLPPDLDVDAQRRTTLERIAVYRKAKTIFDAIVAEIRSTQDPVDFLNAPLDPETLLHAAERGGAGHALVYLAATPWGGIAVAAFSENLSLGTPARFSCLKLPQLTDECVSGLIEARLGDSAPRPIAGFDYAQRGKSLDLLGEHAGTIIGGFDCAQRGNAFDLLQCWPGTTLRERAAVLHAACLKTSSRGTLDTAIQHMLSMHRLLPLFDQTFATLSDDDKILLSSTLSHTVLQQELERCFQTLVEVALRPLMAWLREEGTPSLTLIPCGSLAAFPLSAIPLDDGYTVGETLPSSIAPNARSLLHDKLTSGRRTGVYALGNPYPVSPSQVLKWGEAEASTLALLGGQLGLPSRSSTQWDATRAELIAALQQGLVVDASCHAMFDAHDFLRSHLLLANGEVLTLADMLNHQADLSGLRLFILSACQTAILDLRGARDEVRSLAAGMLQAGAQAVLASLWAVDDEATYLLMVRFAQQWLPQIDHQPPASALARAQQWLRTVTNRELTQWRTQLPSVTVETEERSLIGAADWIVAMRGGRGYRLEADLAEVLVQEKASRRDPDAQPYAAPYYWAGFQITGW